MEKRKNERIADTLSKIEDVQNGLIEIIEKIAALQIELLGLPKNEFEEKTTNAHFNATNYLDKLKSAIEKYQTKN